VQNAIDTILGLQLTIGGVGVVLQRFPSELVPLHHNFKNTGLSSRGTVLNLSEPDSPDLLSDPTHHQPV
jgi:hypothetical protein